MLEESGVKWFLAECPSNDRVWEPTILTGAQYPIARRSSWAWKSWELNILISAWYTCPTENSEGNWVLFYLLFPPMVSPRAFLVFFPLERTILCAFRPITSHILCVGVGWGGVGWGGVGWGGVGLGGDNTTHVSCYATSSSLALDTTPHDLHLHFHICGWGGVGCGGDDTTRVSCNATSSSLALDTTPHDLHLHHSGPGTHFKWLGCIQKSQSEHFGPCTRDVSRCYARPWMAVGVKTSAGARGDSQSKRCCCGCYSKLTWWSKSHSEMGKDQGPSLGCNMV